VLHPDEITVAFVTAAGLKTLEAVADCSFTRLAIKPTLTSFEKALDNLAQSRR
jgi:hypothetical protein